VHVETVKVHDHRKPETATGVHRLDRDVPELDQDRLAACTSKRSDIERRDLIRLAVPTPPVRNGASPKTNELGQRLRRSQRFAIQVNRPVPVTVNHGHLAGKTFGMRARERLAWIVPRQMNLTEPEVARGHY
jgi:hypothetical protein